MKAESEIRVTKAVINRLATGSAGVITTISVAMLLLAWCGRAATLEIVQLEPTPLFPLPAAGQPSTQVAMLHLNNAGQPVSGRVSIKVGESAAYVEDLGGIAAGRSTNEIHLTEVSAPTKVVIDIFDQNSGRSLARRELDWKPEKKWRIFCVSYSHHDLGYGNYPHRLRTEIRHANIERPLKFCTETDGWDDDSKFRFMIETSEPITSFLASHGEADAVQLGRRIREGRIQIGGVHNTANTEQLSHELMARLFYLTGRHSRDLLDVPASRTAQIDDVIGLTWPLATFCAAADIPYFFHGHNGCSKSLLPAANEPVFYWQGPDAASQVLVRSVDYGGYAGDNIGDGSADHIRKSVAKLGANWPYDALLLQEGTDFQLVTMDTAQKIRAWNSRYRYPHMIYATMDMFFDAIARQMDPSKINTYAKDGNNHWADQDSNDAWLLGQARPQGEAIPTAEKLSTIAQAVIGGGYPWVDLYQAYHRLLAYHEHTDAIDGVGPDKERMRQYETELQENREMVIESREFSGRALTGALDRLSAAIERKSERTIVVFNPLARERTDLVRVTDVKLAAGDELVDTATGSQVPWQTIPDGAAVFVAASVPSTGYRTFAVAAGRSPKAAPETDATRTVLENRYYRVAFDPATGGITSIRDKELNAELVDQAAPHRFNEYLYERFETKDWNTPTKWHRVGAARLKASAGPVAETMEVEARPTGVEKLKQTVVLYRDLRRIDFVLDLVKSPSGRTDRMSRDNPKFKESVFVAMPFAVPDFSFHHEQPGGVSEPVKDLFDVACTAFYSVRHFSDVSNPLAGVTVSAPESALVEYGYPRSCPMGGPHGEHDFEKTKAPILNSRMYLYLMNNMFDTNVRWDQPGPVRFTYSIRSHSGDWKTGRADEFGWDVQNPLIGKEVSGTQTAGLPADRHSFMSIDKANVACTTLKPAEANGAGFILRFVETQGRETAATVTLPCLGRITSANETSLVEEDRSEKLPVDGTTVAFTLRPFGVKTIRVLNRPPAGVSTIAGVEAQAESDMEVGLRWRPDGAQAGVISHYNVYRGTKPDFKPGLLNLVQRPSGLSCVDRPQLHYGGWINNRLEPATTYYYRISAVDRWNNEGPLSTAVPVATMKSSERDMKPLRVECLRSVLVSPLSKFNFVNLLFRTACERDVTHYEVHRATTSGFTAGDQTLVGNVKSQDVPPRSGGYGETQIRYSNSDYDHLMFQDEAVQPATTYCYKVRAVDAAGQKGPFSLETSVRTKDPTTVAPFDVKASASSVYASQYAPENAIDGELDPTAAWISASWGGGSSAEPRDTWLVIELPRKLKLKGTVYYGDKRAEIPIQRDFQVQVRQDQQWTTVVNVTGATGKVMTNLWSAAIETDALRFFVAGKDLPGNDPAGGVVRVCELNVLLPDGTEASPTDLK